MDITIFLAKVLGWYLVITSVFTLTQPHSLKAFVKDYVTKPTLIFFMAIFTLILGLILVISHNHWIMGWPVIITILAWLTLLAGILRLFAPEFHIKMLKKCSNKPNYLVSMSIIYLLVGLYLLYRVHFVI